MADLVRLFRTVSRPAARDLVAAILDRPLAERGRSEAHQPVHGPEAKLRQSAVAPRTNLPARTRPATKADVG